MPHVIVKLWPGKSERQKARLAREITKDVISQPEEVDVNEILFRPTKQEV